MGDRRVGGGPPLIVSRTPLRVSFAGGGTDLPAYYEVQDGMVLSTAISRYVYVTVKQHSHLFFEPVRINYSRSEQVDRIDEIENDIARECLTLLGIDPPIYISTVGDVPASTGLGGSSAFAVGLLNALHAYRGERVSAGQLAEEAAHVEMGILRQPIGKQDQYAAAFGGMNLYTFKADGGVTAQHQRFSSQVLDDLFAHVLMLWTGHQRDAEGVLAEQKDNTDRMRGHLTAMRDQALELSDVLSQPRFDLAAMASILDRGWQLKRELASKITTGQIDVWYDKAVGAGARGGKLCGAGGGGFLLFLVEPSRRAEVRESLGDLVEMDVRYESYGSQVMQPFAE
jgi:D-glycero-alpha-D-manno-heptose-7-phosphate kinase